MKNIHCPNCGHIFPTVPTRSQLHRQPQQRYRRTRYHAGAGLADEADISIFRAPARAAGLQEDVATPIWQAGITGFLIGGVSIWPTAWYGWPLFVPFAIASTTWAGVWLVLLADHRRQLWQEERYEREIPPGEAPAPEPAREETRRIRLDVEEDPRHIKRAHLPLTDAKLQDVARLILSGRSFSVANTTGRGGPLSRSEYEDLRHWLINNGYANWVDPANRQQGIEFGAKGLAFWKALAGKKRRA